jgi:Na+/H+ antiporter
VRGALSERTAIGKCVPHPRLTARPLPEGEATALTVGVTGPVLRAKALYHHPMNLFESLLALLLVAVVLLRLSHRLGLPYPTLLALAGAGVAALPFAPAMAIQPELALALFIPPALFDVAFDTAPRELRRLWVPLFSLVVVAVLLTTVAVAWVGRHYAGLPLAACIVLGAIVAPPDTAAANAVLSRLKLPRRAIAVLQGESLLNDAVALLIFATALNAAMQAGPITVLLPHLLIAAPGGVIVGLLFGLLHVRIRPWFAGTQSARIVEFVMTYAVWIVAARLQLSPILAIVACAMYLAQRVPARSTARERVHAYSVWATVVFVLNVLAFLLMGLQARLILSRLQGQAFVDAMRVAGLVVLAVILVRVFWISCHGLLVRLLNPHFPRLFPLPPRTRGVGMVIGWCGMRGLVTLGTAFALPEAFPGRDVIVLSAFAVVIGTLVLQGLTLAPLIRLLGIEADESLQLELSAGRAAILDAALASLVKESGPEAEALRREYRVEEQIARASANPQAETEYDRLRRQAVAAQRATLDSLRRSGLIAEDVFHRLEEDLDWAELAALPPEGLALEEI